MKKDPNNNNAPKQPSQSPSQNPTVAASTNLKALKAQKEKERLDRELDILSTITTTPPGTTTTTTTTTSTSTSTTAPTTLQTAAKQTAAAATNTSESPLSPTLAHLQSLKSKLEQTALSMGLDTSSIRGGRGGFRGRGGAAGRGRGRGRGGALVLDNRTTSILILDIPEDFKMDNVLRAHFQVRGEIVNISRPSTDKAVVQFASRRSAEMALAQSRQYKTTTLQMGWYNPLKPLSETSASSSASEVQNDDATAEVDQSTESTYEEEYEEEEEEEETERSWKHS